MQRIIVSLLLCAALACGSVWSLRAVEDSVGAVISDIEADEVEQAHEKWEDAQNLLGALLLHTEIDQADRLFDRMLTAKAAGSKTDYLLDRAELLAQLRHLPELQRPNNRNLF